MKAITYSAFGPAADVLHLTELATPEPGAGEVRVRLSASGVNPSDIRARAGGRPGVAKPPFDLIIPHSDGAGVIDAVGKGVPTERLGERVWIWNGAWKRAFGTAAEHIVLPKDQAVPLPDSASFEDGAVLGIPGLTATHVVLGDGPVEGHTVLVSGGAGSVGHLAVQIAAASGARVIATAGAGAGIAAAKLAGADAVFDYRAPDLADQIMEATGGQGIDRIIEVEFGQNIATNTAVIKENGRLIAYGSAKDMTPQLPFYPLMFKAVRMELALIYLLTPEQRQAATGNLMALLERGALVIRIAEIFPLGECAAAHDLVASGARAGAVLLDCS
ncbi:MAG: NADPH:quinone reductase [Pseudomonadota bacterium]